MIDSKNGIMKIQIADPKNPIEFNGYNHSFTLEIIELDEELLKINPATGFVE